MRKAIVLTFVAWMSAQPPVFAADDQKSSDRPVRQSQPAQLEAGTVRHNLLEAGLRAGARLGATETARHGDPAGWFQPAPQNRSWIGRHPAFFGALVGAGAGALASVTMENELFCSGGDEDCFFHGGSRALVGAAMGAGIGSMIGFFVGLGSQ